MHGLGVEKEGLAAVMRHGILYTPLDKNLSSGIVCFGMDGLTPLIRSAFSPPPRYHRSGTSYSSSFHARRIPGIYTPEKEVEEVLRVIYELEGKSETKVGLPREGEGLDKLSRHFLLFKVFKESSEL